jgi:hypothetical protein
MKQFISILAIAAIATTTSVIADSCTSASSKEKEAIALAAQQRTIDSMKAEIAKKQVMDSMTDAAAQAEAAKPKVVQTTRTHTRTVYVNQNNPGTAPAAQPVTTVTKDETVTTEKKKGWSAKAKGAVIGAGAGAITGAMVSDQKGKGAIIGGVLGAGAGLGVGAIVDKKQGR